MDRLRAHLQPLSSYTSGTSTPILNACSRGYLSPEQILADFEHHINLDNFKMTKRASDQFMAMDDEELDMELEDMPVTDSCDVVRYAEFPFPSRSNLFTCFDKTTHTLSPRFL
jgi:hypothetical protein